MMRIIAALFLSIIVVGGGLPGIPAPASAHPQKVLISSLSHNERTDRLEAMHRISLHDAEHALERLGLKAADIVQDGESRRAFVRYVDERFAVAVNGKPVRFTMLGSEIEGGTLFVYAEAPSPGRGTQLSVRSQILADIWRGQENRVNLGSGTKVETLVFAAGDPAKTGILP